MRARPELDEHMSAEDFRDHDWMKSDLRDFLRLRGLPASGSKGALAARVEAWLDGAPMPWRG
ncbi:hypothetical protein ATO6_17865 [Oceanicola sp. 22II-s10i]|uniref:SAP domain-containing protein n=1 Tax=Oceanicola sp. 22II-s10i TaxID=1317116 RepID=UPI000B5222D0|nr:SAP domain-containing protein [Oceanicola sp. 22II-s10i]OWU83721.1 hypothetical protein ATO6_17865 [Oceanicola sp. 22II-s10i]